MKKLPKSLKIGAVRYQVRIKDDWVGSDGTDGEMFYDKENGYKIYIRANLAKEAQETTLLHEILHALNATVDHEFLDSFAEQIYTVLKENRLDFSD